MTYIATTTRRGRGMKSKEQRRQEALKPPASVSLRVPPELFAKIEAYRAQQPIRPTLKETVVYLLDKAMKDQKP